MFSEAQLLVCVRDLRAILASIEKQHAKNPLLDEAGRPVELTVAGRADKLFSPEGLVGQHIMGVMDLVNRQLPYVHIIQYEQFVRNPAQVLERVYSALEEGPFAHNFENVESTASDVDGVYLHKFPHDGSGKIEPSSDNWQEHVPPNIAAGLMQTFTGYNQAFGYY